MSARVSIYIPAALLPTLDLLGPAGRPGLSRRIATILERYAALVASARLAMPRHHWCAVMAALDGGRIMHACIPNPAHLAAAVQDYLAGGGMTAWGLTQPEAARLVGRLRRLTVPETLYLVESTERFRRRADQPTDAALEAAGCIIAAGDFEEHP